MTIQSPRVPIRSEPTGGITALVVTTDHQYRDRVERTLDGDGFAIRTAGSIPAPTSLTDLDCLVCERTVTNEGANDPLERVRRQVPGLPVVFLLDGVDETVAGDERRASAMVDCHVRGTSAAAVDRLGRRITALVERRRLAARTRRALASVALSGEPVALVDADGTVEFATGSFAVLFGHDRETLLGRPWQTLFTDESVTRIERTAIPTVTDGWRWTGTCTGRRESGSTFRVNVRLDAPDDGDLVFVTEPVDSAGSG